MAHSVTSWVVVIPVKGTALAKSRLEVSLQTRGELALAFALDTVRAAVAAERVDTVLVVTASDVVAEAVGALGAVVLRETQNAGLNPSIKEAIAVVEARYSGSPVAVLLGDVPALQSSELDEALRAAGGYARAFVPDAAGIGTVLLCALDPAMHEVRFGGQSRAAHRATGYTELTVDVRSGLRRDIDTVDDLEAARALQLGSQTRRLLMGSVN
jgi:2-phospho-L-lactate guanylyltransferase